MSEQNKIYNTLLKSFEEKTKSTAHLTCLVCEREFWAINQYCREHADADLSTCEERMCDLFELYEFWLIYQTQKMSVSGEDLDVLVDGWIKMRDIYDLIK